MIDVNLNLRTVVAGVIVGAVGLWAAVYLSAALTQLIVLGLVAVVLVIGWAATERVKRRLTGDAK